MLRTNKTLKVLGIALAMIMVPLFMGLVCPCANAAADQTVIQSQPCQGCCPEMMASQGACDAKLETRDAVKTPEFSPLVFSFEAFVSPGFLSHAFHVPTVGPPVDRSISRHEPLFVLNQVFRL